MHIVLPVLLFVLIVQLLLLLIYGFSRVLLPKGPVRLEINGEERHANAGQTLLNALYSSEIFIPSACGGKGTCGYCKVTVTKGDATPLATELDFLSRAERKSGVRLACQVKLLQPMSIQIPEEYLNAREFTSTVRSATSLTHDIKELTFALPEGDPFEFLCGQYIQVKIPNDDSPEGYVFRAYSIASPEYERESVTLNVKLIPGGIGSSWLHNLSVGDEVTFTGPYGDWKLTPETQPLVLIGGGVGMAPMRSIILSVLQFFPQKPLWLFFGARTQKDLLYHEVFVELAKEHQSFHYIPALSDLPADDPWAGDRGFIHLAFDKRYPLAGDQTQAFLCGPPPMIAAAMDSLELKDIPKSSVFYDNFET